MASWTALNVEPESDIEEEEYDDTKEIQIEDALKLYQQALKLHALGPSSFDEAEKAYQALFRSEIFSYPESQTQYERLLSQEFLDRSAIDDELLNSSAVPLSKPESAPDTLPQVLYLSYKNYGQFLIDRVVYQTGRTQHQGLESPSDGSVSEASRDAAWQSLELLVQALDKDETDPQLWRKIARVSNYLGNRRIARYALESALALKEGGEMHMLGTLSLEERSIREELADVLRSIGEDASSIKHISPSGKPINKELKARLGPFPALQPTPAVKLGDLAVDTSPIILQASQRTWESVGQALKAAREADMYDYNGRLGVTYQLSLPDEGRRADQTSNTTDLIAAEVLAKSRLSQSPKLSTKQSLLDQTNTSTSQSTSTGVGRKSLGAGLGSDAQLQSLIDEAEINKAVEIKSPENVPTATMDSRPSSKRNSETAGLQEPPEGGRSRSKRLRARAETLAEEAVDPEVLTKHYEEQLQQYARADERLFSVAFEMTSKAGVIHIHDASTFRSLISADANSPRFKKNPAVAIASLMDFKSCLTSWKLNNSNLLLNGTGNGASVTLIDNGADSGFSAFLEHSKSGPKKSQSSEDLLQDQDLLRLVDRVNAGNFAIQTTVYFWIEALLKPTWNPRARSSANLKYYSKYTKYSWSNEFKELLFTTLVDEDDVVHTRLWNDLSPFNNLHASTNNSGFRLENEELSLIEFAQTVFELHLDFYGRITSPDSRVDQPTRITQKHRIRRWAELANLAVSRHDLLNLLDEKAKSLALRHLWSYVTYVSFVEPSSRDHILFLYQDLKRVLEENGSPVFHLSNNAIMPEVSITALEREMSKEKTMDFFTNIFSASSEDPISLIESLEPVLMETLIQSSQRETKDSQDEDPVTQETASDEGGNVPTSSKGRGADQLIGFLQKATPQLRLSLWHQLKTAYEKIDYPPMEFICNIRSMEIIVKELQSQAYARDTREERSANLIVWIRNLADLATQCLDLAKLPDSSAFDFLDDDNLNVALTYCLEVLKLFHIFAVWEDSLRVGQLQPPPQPAGSVVPHKNSMTFLREMQPKIWQLLYLLCLEATNQHPQAFSTAAEDRLKFLRAVHNVFGLREYCRLGRKAFLKSMKSELIYLDAPEDEISQVLYDLYGLKICQNSSNLLDHGCTGDQIDRASALEIVPFVIAQADGMNVKDVLKSDLKVATEKMQAVIGTPRGSSTHQTFNRKTVVNFIKAPVITMSLIKSLRGLTELSMMPVSTEFATVARQKWFFLIGHVHLAKYRSQKRLSQDTSDDLDTAEKFLKLALEFNTESWETWYRLAQTYDAKIEELVAWKCESINDPGSDLVIVQKQGIHCYEMAVSTAMRLADESFETASRLSELYADFATRIYSSSRAPFNMEPFSLEGHQRYGNRAGVGTFKQRPSTPLQTHTAWKIASELYRKALSDKPDSWINWYMLGKCRWKLFQSRNNRSIGWRDPVDAFIKAIKCIPEKRDSRHPEKDPILEPHYKLLAIVYKLLRNRDIQPSDGIHVLQTSHFAKKVPCRDSREWKPYILEVLRVLRAADKANWHHRMAARAAQLVYDENFQTQEAAQSAKEKLTQQIFTKSMIVQVWKPEFERPGRHFVYLSRYVRFFVKLLEQLGDRTSLELLGKRIRKKQNEFIEHEIIWKSTSHAHLHLLRKQGEIPVGHEDMIFKNAIPFEVFTLNANRLETWGHSQLSLAHPTLALLVEAVELKKLNGMLIDKTPFDDLVGDLYARVYEEVVPGLIAKAGEEENRERMRIQRMLMDSGTPQPESSTGENATHSGRTKTISRTEVRKRAEVLVARPGVQTGRGKTSGIIMESGPTSISRRQSELKPLPNTLAPQSDVENEASLQESADDESELSEIDEEEEEPEDGEQQLLFPNLAPQLDGASRESTISAEQGDKMEGVAPA